MADKRKNNGGKRENAGRKSKAEELGLSDLIDSVWTLPEQKKTLRKLVLDCNSKTFQIRHESRKLLMAYKFGKPTEKHEHTGADGGEILYRVVEPGENGNESENS